MVQGGGDGVKEGIKWRVGFCTREELMRGLESMREVWQFAGASLIGGGEGI